MALIVGLLLLVLGAVITLDVRGLGTKLIGFNQFVSAPPWSRNPTPDPDRVEARRLVFGCGVAVSGLIVLIVGLSSLV